jgi:hypothetical protein
VAENIWHRRADWINVMDEINTALATEATRLSESCLYTSGSLFIWLRVLRWTKIIFTVVPLILGSLAGWKALASTDVASVKILIAICSFGAGLFPAIYSALKFDDKLEQCAHLAGEFKLLEHRLRQCAKVHSLKSFAEFEKSFEGCMKRLEAAKSISLTPPEWCFKMAQRKIKKGHYDFTVDEIEKKAV